MTQSESAECRCVWKGKMQGPRGWVELIDSRDPDCPLHSDCAYAGHEWEPAGGGLLICVNCTAEKWADDA